MKKILFSAIAVTLGAFMTTGCIQELSPMTDYATKDQVNEAPGAYQNLVDGITSSMLGQFLYSTDYPYDYGYPTFFQMRDVMGQDIVIDDAGHWYQTWYTCSTALGPRYAVAQFPWTIYYAWIKNCNTVLSLAGDEPDESHKTGAGIALAMRAMYYMDMARMFAPKTYALDKQAETVPIITEKTTVDEMRNNPRATNEKMWAFIISDLDKAEQYLEGYQRKDISTPDQSVVYGLKARAYQVMEDWANAEKYAKLAQEGYTMMSQEEYLNRETGFNTPNSSWMFGMQFKSTDPVIVGNDADGSWGSFMYLEVNGSGCGYASSYGYQFSIDRHLYETIPATDFRKKCFVDFAIDELTTTNEEGQTVPDKEAIIEKLKAYSDYPEYVYQSGYEGGVGPATVGGFSLKFRAAGGAAGHTNQYIGFLGTVPFMRVEEMKLIEIEAVGMQNESKGIELLTDFAKTRDPEYVYGKHNDAYNNQSTSAFQNEVWWQRRVELWGEGFATFDIKRLNKGIIRSYANTNHLETFRWNTQTPPDWMNLCIVETETMNNTACTNNPTPIAPSSDSDEFIW